MTTFSANFLCRTAIGLRYREPLISWIKRSNQIECSYSKGRDYSTSFPIRYIPNKSSKGEESIASSLPTQSFDNIKKHKALEHITYKDGTDSHRNQDRINSTKLEISGDIRLEEEYMEEPKELKRELSCNGIETGRNKEDAEKLVIKLLGIRAFTAVQLRKKLIGKKFPLKVVNEVISDFESRGYINDGLYAETLSRSRWSSSCWGPNRIKQALFEKGVSKVDTEKALKVVFQDGESEDNEGGYGMSKVSMDRLIIQASKQWLKSQDVSKEKRKTRLVRWLQYRGFNWGVISFVLKKLESESPP